MKFLEPTRKPKVIFVNSFEFGKSGEELFWNHCASTPHKSETYRIAERAVRRVKEGTSAVLLQSGLDNEWWADSMECYCYLRNSQDLLSDGRTPYERRFAIPFNGRGIPFGAMVEYHSISAKDPSRLRQFGPKVLPGIFLCYASNSRRIWKGDIPVADIEELEQMDASEIHARRLNAKEVLTPMKNEKLVFPAADGTVKISGGNRRLRTSTLIRDRPERGEEQEILRGESGGLFSPSPLQDDSTREDAEAKNDFGSITRDLIYRHHVEPPCETNHAERRNISYSTEVHRRLQNYTYVTWCIVGKTYWWLLERRWRSRIVRCMDLSHKIYFIEWKAPDG